MLVSFSQPGCCSSLKCSRVLGLFLFPEFGLRRREKVHPPSWGHRVSGERWLLLRRRGTQSVSKAAGVSSSCPQGVTAPQLVEERELVDWLQEPVSVRRRRVGSSQPQLLPLFGRVAGRAAFEQLGAFGQQGGSHFALLLEAAGAGDLQVPTAASAGLLAELGLAAAEVGLLVLPRVRVGGRRRQGGLGRGRRRCRHRPLFDFFPVAGQRFPPGARGRGAVSHLLPAPSHR